MDYEKWGLGYLEEAEKIKQHVDSLQKVFSKLSGEDEVCMLRRISMLRAMYFECLHTGRWLVERGKIYEAQEREHELGGKHAGSAERHTGT